MVLLGDKLCVWGVCVCDVCVQAYLSPHMCVSQNTALWSRFSLYIHVGSVGSEA